MNKLLGVEGLPKLPEGYFWKFSVDPYGDCAIKIMKTETSAVLETVKSVNPAYRWWKLSGSIPKFLYTRVETGETSEAYLPVDARILTDADSGVYTFTDERALRVAKEMSKELKRKGEMRKWFA